MRTIQRLSALLLTSALLLGLPYALLVHLPWPDLSLSWTVLAVHLSGLSLPPGVPQALLIGTLWGVWGLFALSVVTEIAARARGRQRGFRLFGPLQVIAATAIGTTLAVPAQAMADTVVVHDVQTDTADASDAQAPAAAPQAPADQDAGQEQETQRVRSFSGFALNSAEPTEDMREDLASTVELIRKHGAPDSPIVVTGHTDASGSDAVNQELSERRAQGVADHLAAELGDKAPDIQVEGLGATRLQDGADTQDQRRVEVSYTVAPAAKPKVHQPVQEPVQQPEQAPAAGQAEEITEMAMVKAVTQVPGADSDEAALQQAAVDSPPKVVVMEIPAGGLLSTAAFAGLVGGFLVGRRGTGGLALSLPKPRALTAGIRRERPESPEIDPPKPPPELTDGIDDRVVVELNHIPGIGITGPGAPGAARRLIANALSGEEERSARVLITDSDASMLLGDEGRTLLSEQGFEAVRVVDTMHDALAILQRELHENAADPDAVDDQEPLVLVATPVAEYETALSGLLLHGQERGITAVLLGRWPLGGTCTIGEDGVITDTSPPLSRIFQAQWPGCDAEHVMDLVREYDCDGATVEYDSHSGTVGYRSAEWAAELIVPTADTGKKAESAKKRAPATPVRADRWSTTEEVAAEWADTAVGGSGRPIPDQHDIDRVLSMIAAPDGPSPWKQDRESVAEARRDAVVAEEHRGLEVEESEQSPAEPAETVETVEPVRASAADTGWALGRPVDVPVVAESAPVVEEPVEAAEPVREPVAHERQDVEVEESAQSPVEPVEPVETVEPVRASAADTGWALGRPVDVPVVAESAPVVEEPVEAAEPVREPVLEARRDARSDVVEAPVQSVEPVREPVAQKPAEPEEAAPERAEAPDRSVEEPVAAAPSESVASEGATKAVSAEIASAFSALNASTPSSASESHPRPPKPRSTGAVDQEQAPVRVTTAKPARTAGSEATGKTRTGSEPVPDPAAPTPLTHRARKAGKSRMRRVRPEEVEQRHFRPSSKG
ncbi:OmpA family protein [Nocardiopsis ansamitocini]|uniref:OmpA-like domain-containing protein n=1 Tax=Nocardiopsis ansamitocini TaxID=1670832 RepID=A0A9W6UII9_9ACTN|nr:OmpA family protein [Nocardiopsis ansamitocini]GLU47478.1 hypothetical protein Nans01_18290 [Nocardiopsis ansamitocini]